MSSLGSYLKEARDQKQVSLMELAQITRIPARILGQLEGDEYDKLPADVFVRGFLRSYARSLDLDEEHVLARYTGQRTSEPSAPSLPAAVYAPESGRRFGIAIALFILLILFTLALSLVLRPRHRDTPGELSSLVPCAVQPSSPKPCSYAAPTTVTRIASSRC